MQNISAEEELEPTSPLDFYMHNEYKRKCKSKVLEAKEACMEMPMTQLKQICKRSIDKPAQLQKKFIANLERLYVRFGNTTNEKEGGWEFRKDIDKVHLDMQFVFDAGVAGLDAVKFCPYEERKINLHF